MFLAAITLRLSVDGGSAFVPDNRRQLFRDIWLDYVTDTDSIGTVRISVFQFLLRDWDLN